jgi:hypothetical protein
MHMPSSFWSSEFPMVHLQRCCVGMTASLNYSRSEHDMERLSSTPDWDVTHVFPGCFMMPRYTRVIPTRASEKHPSTRVQWILFSS